ncbi:E3 SUMO-protein ligase RanBP2 [Galdieria sulphuraria]|uniref:E3 SUMO-protein ligase RanBP2 n=1 Tax=Galdieria sulphuraria TaxID=130081 RepID=M2XB10_GALSU|nr:E3 SUMO-protein ligase RanBP2 [Galdieria sulphuraria]EME27087.1 E3 SUMO-protein ligase RanBP2 [Galdieria sulphuraria]GJD05645.1 E3 SUMO-protein ligase RanBP2 [Galdieria sulphuraria]|eukprot:XP_005703607.1 E3 SUMO-protein ligase RanBP2 [Galdieria sulphuraria]
MSTAPTKEENEEPQEEQKNEQGDEKTTLEEDYSVPFKPLVTLDEVQVTTGEEEEDVLYKNRAKLFRFDKQGSQWKERGTGDLKILQHKDTKKIRLLMRREKTLKICLNHYVNPSIQLEENVGSDRSWVWNAIDYADEVADECVLAVRFPNSEQAKKFKQAYDDARSALEKITEVSLNSSQEKEKEETQTKKEK